jgi:hypothetical protein
MFVKKHYMLNGTIRYPSASIRETIVHYAPKGKIAAKEIRNIATL